MLRFLNVGEAGPRFGKINFKVVGCVGLSLFLLLGAAGVAGGLYWYKMEADKAAKEAERKRILDALNPELQAYLDLTKANPGKRDNKFKGKVVCLDMNKKQLDVDSVLELPESLRATKPDEVGALACLTWQEEQGGDYPDGAKAMLFRVYVIVIANKTGALVCAREIIGQTQQEKSGAGDRVGPKPWDKIVEFLKEYQETN